MMGNKINSQLSVPCLTFHDLPQPSDLLAHSQQSKVRGQSGLETFNVWGTRGIFEIHFLEENSIFFCKYTLATMSCRFQKFNLISFFLYTHGIRIENLFSAFQSTFVLQATSLSYLRTFLMRAIEIFL